MAEKHCAQRDLFRLPARRRLADIGKVATVFKGDVGCASERRVGEQKAKKKTGWRKRKKDSLIEGRGSQAKENKGTPSERIRKRTVLGGESQAIILILS